MTVSYFFANHFPWHLIAHSHHYYNKFLSQLSSKSMHQIYTQNIFHASNKHANMEYEHILSPSTIFSTSSILPKHYTTAYFQIHTHTHTNTFREPGRCGWFVMAPCSSAIIVQKKIVTNSLFFPCTLSRVGGQMNWFSSSTFLCLHIH